MFACRAEYRPNPIALTTCRVLGVDEASGVVRVADIDAFDGTPLLDLDEAHRRPYRQRSATLALAVRIGTSAVWLRAVSVEKNAVATLTVIKREVGRA